MTDYVVGTGNNGLLIIRDDGFNLQAIIVNNNGSTYANGIGWQVNLGGGAAAGTFNISGGQTIVVWAGSLGAGGNVAMSFTMGATGTIGLGGPTTVYATIIRATVPPPPHPVGLDQILPTSMRYRFNGAGDGGSAILQWQIQYGISGVGPAMNIDSGGTTVLTGLKPGTSYNVYSRGRNAVGWGGYSSSSVARTLTAVRFKVGGVWKLAVPYVKSGGIWKIVLPYVKVSGVWKATG